MNNIDKISLNDIVSRAIIELGAIGVTGVYDLLSIDDTEPTDGFEVMHTILKETIDRFEYLEPFCLTTNILFNAGTDYEFIDNFDEYLEGRIQRRYLQLIPRKILTVINTYNGTTRGLMYEAPILYNSSYSGQFTVNYFANRPLRWSRVENKYSDDSYYYYLGELHKPALLRFRNLFLLNLAKYIVRLNENTKHPNLPLDTMEGLSNFATELDTKVTNDFEISHGYWPVYK